MQTLFRRIIRAACVNRTSLAVLLLMCVVPLQSFAQGAPPSPFTPADKAAIAHYTLNEDVFNRLLAVVADAHTQGIDKEPHQPDMSKVHSLDDLTNQIVGADPRIAPMLSKHGFTPRDYMLANMAMTNAVMASEAKQNPQIAGYIDPSQQNAANVSFYEAHKAQLDALRQPPAGEAQPGNGQ
ncbi:MAG: hypothetical protein WA777_12510 [Rhodanobacter sp.]